MTVKKSRMNSKRENTNLSPVSGIYLQTPDSVPWSSHVSEYGSYQNERQWRLASLAVIHVYQLGSPRCVSNKKNPFLLTWSLSTHLLWRKILHSHHWTKSFLFALTFVTFPECSIIENQRKIFWCTAIYMVISLTDICLAALHCCW